jgi:hypothetical protein
VNRIICNSVHKDVVGGRLLKKVESVAKFSVVKNGVDIYDQNLIAEGRWENWERPHGEQKLW